MVFFVKLDPHPSPQDFDFKEFESTLSEVASKKLHLFNANNFRGRFIKIFLYIRILVKIVKKKDGSTRFCMGYRKQNSVTIKDAYPLPHINESRDYLSGNIWYHFRSVLRVLASICKRGPSKNAFVICKGKYFLPGYRYQQMCQSRALTVIDG